MSPKVDSKLVTSSDGAKIYANAIGDPKLPAVVFVHGFTLSCVVFDNIFLESDFSNKFYLVRYDMRGHGRSAKPDTIEGYSSKIYADDFAVVCAAFSLNRPVFVGWSLGATVLADVAAHLPGNFLSGAVYLAGLPYIGPIMQRVGTPTVLGFLDGLFSEDVNLSNKTLIDFGDSLFTKPEEVSWTLKCQWLGMAVCQSPKHRNFVVSRPQDPTKLHALGASGFPLLVLGGTQDRQVQSNVVADEMKPHFREMEVCFIKKNGGHAVHYENPVEVLGSIEAFAARVTANSEERRSSTT